MICETHAPLTLTGMQFLISVLISMHGMHAQMVRCNELVFLSPGISYRQIFIINIIIIILLWQVAADGDCERDVVHRTNQRYRAWGAPKTVLNNRGLRIKAMKCLYEGVIVPTALMHWVFEVRREGK